MISIKSSLDWIYRIWTGGTILWWGLSVTDTMPFYQVRLYKTNSITPTINFFPGQKIRLSFDAHEPIFQQEIASAMWSLLKGNKILYTDEGLEPTITLPPTQGGSYQLKVDLKMQNGEVKSGKTSFYVVQDTAKQVVFSSSTGVELTTENNTPDFIQKVQSKGAEIYSNGHWHKVPTVSKTQGKVTIQINPNKSISSYNQLILIRAQDASDDLSSYGSVAVPKLTLQLDKNLEEHK